MIGSFRGSDPAKSLRASLRITTGVKSPKFIFSFLFSFLFFPFLNNNLTERTGTLSVLCPTRCSTEYEYILSGLASYTDVKFQKFLECDVRFEVLCDNKCNSPALQLRRR